MATPEQIAARFESVLRRSVDRLEAFQGQLLAQLDTQDGNLQTTEGNLARATLMREQLTSELNRMGFQTTVRELYGDVADALEAEAGTDPKNLAIAETVLAGFASQFTRNLDNAWFTMTGAIQDIVEQATLTNAPIADLVEGLAGPSRASIRLTAPMTAPYRSWLNYASSAVDTALSAMIRRLQIITATEAGVSHFIYAGTNISTTRPFCRLMQGVVVTMADLRDIGTDPELSNIRRLRDKDGRQPPIATTLGGWRCRHNLLGTSLRDAKDDGRTIFAEKKEALNRLAGTLL
jgi:hypothetical protein